MLCQQVRALLIFNLLPTLGEYQLYIQKELISLMAGLFPFCILSLPLNVSDKYHFFLHKPFLNTTYVNIAIKYLVSL